MRTALLGLVLTVLLTGCAGTIVDFRTGMELGYWHSDGRQADIAPGRTEERPRVRPDLIAYPNVFYSDNLLSWSLNARTYGIDNEIENLSGRHLTFHWEQAQLSSSQHPSDIPLRSYSSLVAGKWLGPKGYIPDPADRLHTMVPLQLRPGEKSEAKFDARYAELFRSGRLFGVRYEDGRTRLLENGVGEWLLIKLPLDVGEERLTMHIKLTALDAKARTVIWLF